MRIITIEALRQHVFDLWGKADGIELDATDRAEADHEKGTISSYPITSEAAYAVALHEIGHIRQGRHDDVMVGERMAWEWARENALVWMPTMERAAERSLGSYEIKHAQAKRVERGVGAYGIEACGIDYEHRHDVEQYFYKQISECIRGLLFFCRSDRYGTIGEEAFILCDTLTRVANEVAQVATRFHPDYSLEPDHIQTCQSPPGFTVRRRPSHNKKRTRQ
jgi:hypothetical protein